MNELQYDSFYKFLVSAGVVLIAAPLFGLYYVLCNGNQILISQADFDALSETSSQFVRQRDQILLYVLRVLPYILIALILLGLICLIYGGIKWRNIQKELDEQTRLKTKEQKANIQKLTATEIAEKVVTETIDEQKLQSVEILTKDKISQAFHIENLCFEYIKRKYSKGYTVQQNIKFNKYACDVIATSHKDNVDFLFEIKYWTQIPPRNVLNRIIERMGKMGIAYESTVHRNFRCILMIVTPEASKKIISSSCNKYLINSSIPIDVKVLTENNLKGTN